MQNAWMAASPGCTKSAGTTAISHGSPSTAPRHRVTRSRPLHDLEDEAALRETHDADPRRSMRQVERDINRGLTTVGVRRADFTKGANASEVGLRQQCGSSGPRLIRVSLRSAAGSVPSLSRTP